MLDQRQIEIVHRRQAQLQHDGRRHGLQPGQQRIAQHRLGLDLVGDRDRHLGFQDRHHARAQNLLAHFELLLHDRGNPHRIGGRNHRPLLGAENPGLGGALQKRIQRRHRFQHLAAVLFLFQTLVDLQEGHDTALFPQIGGGRNAVDVAVHRLFEQDRAHHLVAGKGARLDDPRPHRMDQVIHLGFVRIGVFGDAIEPQRLRRRAARLVKRGNEALALAHVFHHRLRHLRPPILGPGHPGQ